MPCYYDYTVLVPAVKNISWKKINGSVYIYYTYDREKTANGNLAPKNHSIGKLKPDTNPPEMYPNISYYEYFDTNLTEIAGIKHDESIIIGPYVVFRKIVSDLHLDYILKETLGDMKKAEIVLDVAAYEILSESNTLSYYPDYALGYLSFISGLKVYNDSTVSRFVSRLDENVRGKFLNSWTENLKRSENAVIITDSTNKNTTAKNASLPKYGKAKEKKKLPIVNYAITYDTAIGLPIYYEVYSGNINDVSQYSKTVENVHALGYKDVEGVNDRGYQSKKNLHEMLNNEMDYTIILKGMKKIAADCKFQAHGLFEGKEEYRILGTNLYAYTVSRKLYPNDQEDCYFHVFYSEYSASRQKKFINDTVDQYMAELKPMIGTAKEIDSKYNLYYDISYSTLSDGAKVISGVERNIQAIQEDLDEAGYFIVVSTKISNAQEAHAHISIRDMNEKLFEWDKSFLGAKTQRSHTDENIRGRFFVEFIACIIRSVIYNELKKRNHVRKSKLYGLCVPEAIRELKNVVADFRPDLKYHLQYNENTCVKEILAMFDLNTDSTKAAVERLNYELGLSSKVPKNTPSALSPTEAGIETKTERLITGLTLIRDTYRELVQEMRINGADSTELDKQISTLIEPAWIQYLE